MNMEKEIINTPFEIEKTKRYAQLSNELNAAREYFNSVKTDTEMMEMYEYDGYGDSNLISTSTMEDKINFVKRFSNNATAMAYLNMINAQDRLSEYVCTVFNTQDDNL